MPYKYSNETKALKEKTGDVCFVNYSEKDIEAFRWVFPNIDDERNFIPLAVDQENSSVRRRCGGWALSFHETEVASTEMWETLTENKPNKYKKLGTHIAKGNISKTDGKCSDSDRNSHFNLIEYKDTDFSGRFEIVKQLASEEMIKSL